MSVAQCEDAVQKFIVEMSSFVNSYHIWGITKLHHSFGRALDNFAPMVSGTSMGLNCILEEFRMVRDCVSGNLNIYQANCNTNVERQNWDRQFAGWSDKDALLRLRSMQRRLTQFPILASSRDYKRNLRASIIMCLWFRDIRNYSLLISWKTWENENALQCFKAHLQQFISEFLQFSRLVSTNLRHHVQVSCNEAFPLLFEMAEDFEKRNSRATLRVRSALAAAVYRRAYHVNPTVRNLPRTAYWEILWANTSMFSFSDVASDDSFIESKGLIYPHKMHKLPTSELKVSQQDLVSLWNLAASILDNPIWQTHLINIMIKIDLKIKSTGVAWPADMEADRVALHNYIIGCSYAGMGMHDLAIDYLLKVSRMKNELKTDLFLVPFSLMEAAMCHYAKNRNGVAESLVQTAFQQYGHTSREFRMLVHSYDYARRHPISKDYLLDTKEDYDFNEDYPDLGLEWYDDTVAGNPDNINRGAPPQQNGNVDEESVKVEEKPATEAEPTDEAKETAASGAIPSASGAGVSADMGTRAQAPTANKACDTGDMFKYKNITGYVEDSENRKDRAKDAALIYEGDILFAVIQNDEFAKIDAASFPIVPSDATDLTSANLQDAPSQFVVDEDDDLDVGEDLNNLFAIEE